MKPENQENSARPAQNRSSKFVQTAIQRLRPALQDLLREAIREIAAGKGDRSFDIKAACRRMQGLLNDTVSAHAIEISQQESLRKALEAALHAEKRPSFREVISMVSLLLPADAEKRQDLLKNRPAFGPLAGVLAPLLPVPGKEQEGDWAPLIQAIERPVLSRRLMRIVARVFQVFWNYSTETDSTAQKDVVFEELCNDLQAALPVIASSSDEKQQISALRVLISAAKIESDWHGHVRHSAEHLLWKSVQVMAGEALKADPELTQRHALLEALLPSHDELQKLWGGDHPLAHWMTWRHPDRRLTRETAGRLGVQFLKNWVSPNRPQLGQNHDDEIVNVMKIIAAWIHDADNQQSEQFEEEYGLTPEQKEGLLDLVHCVMRLPEKMDTDTIEHFIGKVIATPYAQRSHQATSPFEYLLGQILPVADHPGLLALLEQAEVALASKDASAITATAVPADIIAVSAFFRRVMPAPEPELLPYTPDELTTAERVCGHLSATTALLIKKLIQRISTGEGSNLIDGVVKDEFLQYMHTRLDQGIRENQWTASEVRKLQQQISQLAAKEIQITCRELVDRISLQLSMPGKFSSEESVATDNTKGKNDQLRTWETVLMNSLPAGERAQWSPEWQQLATILERRVISHHILAPLRKTTAAYLFQNGYHSVWNMTENTHQDGLRGDWIFSGLLKKLETHLKVLAQEPLDEDEQQQLQSAQELVETVGGQMPPIPSLNQDEQRQLQAIRTLVEDAKKECREDNESWHSAESLVRELSRIMQNLPLDLSELASDTHRYRHALLRELIIPHFGGYDERGLFHHQFETSLPALKALPDSGTRLLNEHAVQWISQRLLNFLTHPSKPTSGDSAADDFSDSVENALKNTDASVVTTQEKQAIKALCAQVKEFTNEGAGTVVPRWGDNTTLTWDLLKAKVLCYLQTPEADRAALSTSFFDDLLFQVLPSPNYAWSDGYDALVKTGGPASLESDSDEHSITLLAETMVGSNKSEQGVIVAQPKVPIPDTGNSLSPPSGTLKLFY